MIKHLRFLIVLLMTLVWSTGGAQTTIDFTKVTWNGGYTEKPYTFKADKSNGSASPTQNDNAKDIRLYAKNKLTVSTTGKKIVKIVFKISTAGKKQWAELTATTGSVVADKANSIAIWENAEGATSVTFTVGDKCKYGTAGTSKAGQFFFNSVDIYELSAGPSKTPTKVAFPAEYSNKTFTFTEGKLEGFSAPTATETNNVEGTIVYSSDNVSAVKVNASTGALSFPGYGEATITATFTPTDAKTYAVSTDSYKVKNEAKKSDNILTFSGDFHSFDNAESYPPTLPEANVSFVGSDTKTYTFISSNGGKSGSARFLLAKKTGKLQSPTFPSYINGYNVVITYGCGGDGYPSVTANGKKVTGTVKGDYNKGTGATLSLDVADGSAFTVTSGTNALAISKIEITPNAVDETESLTLDETATNNNIVAKAGVNVTLKRTMAKGVWNTICLPFDVTYDVAQAAFGNDVKIAELDENSTGTTLSFKNVDAIKATIPYLIKPSEVKTSNEYVFENVNIDAANVNPYFSTTSNFAFVGIYNMVDVTTDVKKIGDDYYAAFLGANNTIFKANVGGKMKGFRAYFAIQKDTAASALRVVIDGTATSIKNIDSEVVESNAPVYNLQGQRVDGNNLTPGIYVKAGKKFVVK